MKFVVRKVRRMSLKLLGFAGRAYRKLVPAPSAPIVQSKRKAPYATDETKSLKGVVVITGSSRGIGLALAEGFVKAGAKVVMNGRDAKVLNQALKALSAYKNNLHSVVADVTKEAGAEQLVQSAIAKFGQIDILINNTGHSGSTDKNIWELSLTEWQAHLETNLHSAFLCSQQAIQWARTHQKELRVINLSSGIVGHGAKHLGPYTVSKSALEALTLSLAIDTADEQDIAIAAIQPRSVRTALTKDYFSTMEYGLMDEPDAVLPIFMAVATAPLTHIHGKVLSDLRFSAQPEAELLLAKNLAAFPAFHMKADIFDQTKMQYTGEDPATYMHFLQNPMPGYPAVMQTISEYAQQEESYRYPDPSYTALRSALSDELQLPADYFSFGTGSSELIIRLIRIFGGKGGEIILTQPTWGSVVFPTLLKWELTPIMIPHLGSIHEKNIQHDLDSILAAITYKTKLIYLVNPCNPTGSLLDKKSLRDFLYQVPKHVMVLLDEAYFNYVEPQVRFHLSEIIDDCPASVIGLRTFSKFFALSGMRVGYAYGRPEALAILDRENLPFNLSSLTQRAAIAALKDQKSQTETYDLNHRERQWIVKQFDAMKIPCQTTQTNFILFDCPLDRSKMRSDLQKQGIYMPNVDEAVGGNLAITCVGKHAHNQKIMEYLRKF